MKKQFQSKSVPRGTRTIWRYLGALFLLFTFAIGQMWAATNAPSGVRNQSSLSYATTDTLHRGGQVYEVFWCNPTSGNVKTKLVKKTHNCTNYEDAGSDKFCVVGSSVGSTTASATANTIDEFTWTASSSPRYWRVRHDGASNYQIVLVVKGYTGVAALHKAGNDLLIKVEKYNTATSAYEAYTPQTTSVSSAVSSHYKTYASLDASDQFKITFYGPGTSGSANRDMMAFSLTVPSSSNKYKVTFDNNGHGGTAPAAQDNIASGGKATEPTDPVDDNYNFGGWYNKANWQADGAEKWNFSTSTVTMDTTLYAKWTDKSVKSDDATLNAFSIDGYSFTETFAATTLDYTVNLPFYASIPATSAVHATKNYTKATLGDVTYDSTNKKYSVTVTAEDNTTTKTYTITLNIASTPTASTSINIEQLVLDHGKKYDIAAAFAAAHIAYDKKGNTDELDSLKNQSGRNEPYLGLKMKKTDASITVVVPASSTLKVKFGNLPSAGIKVTINGVAQANHTSGNFELAATSAIREVVLAAPSTSTIVFKQIMVGENIQSVQLPWLVTYDAGEHGTCETAKETWKGIDLTLPTVTPESGWNFDGWKDDENNDATSPYKPTKDVTLIAQYSAQASPFDLTALTYKTGAAAAVNVGYEDGKYTYNVELPYAPSYDAITVAPTLKVGTSSIKEGAVLTISSLPGAATFTVVAAGGSSEQLYTINFTKKAKDGVLLIGTKVTGNTAHGTVYGYGAGTADVNVSSKSGDYTYKLNGGKYVGVTLADGLNFQAGDIVKIRVTDKQGATGFTLYTTKTADSVLIMDTRTNTAIENGIHELTLPAYAGSQSLYLLRQNNDYTTNMNPCVDSIAVYRPMNPVLTAITINGRDGEIDALDDKHFTVTIPNDANLASLTVVPTIVRNAAHATTPEAVISNSGAWVLTADGDNTYRIMDKDGDYTDYTITLVRDVLKHTVRFMDGTSEFASALVADGESPVAPATDPTKEDYLFQGWAETVDGDVITDWSTISISAAKDFYAKWVSDGAIKLIEAGAINTTNFVTGGTLSSGTVSVDEVNYKYITLAGTNGEIGSASNVTTDRFVMYHATTTKTKIQIHAYANGNARQVRLSGLVEGASTLGLQQTIDVAKNDDELTEYFSFDSDKHRTFYITIPSSADDVYLLQVKVIESGEPLAAIGTAGTSFNFNKGRLFAPQSVATSFDGIDIKTYNKYAALSTEYAELSAGAISFYVPNDVCLSVASNANGTNKYYVTNEVTGTDNETTTANAEFNLTGGKTWYIRLADSSKRVRFTNIAFTAPKCEKPTISAQPESKQTFGPGNLTATVVVATPTDGGTLKYQWYKAADDSKVDGATEATMTTTTEGTYYVIVTNTLADHSDNSVKSESATLGYRVMDDATLKSLKYGTTAIALEDGVYEYRVDLAENTTEVPALSATATMAPYPTVVITNATEFVNYEATSTVVVTSEDGTTTQTYTVHFYVDHIYTALVDVTGTTTWNWTGSEEATINDVANKGLILANYIDGLNFEKIEGKEGERARRDQNDGVYQGTHLHFNTTVPGKVKFYFRAPSSGEECVITVINNGKEIRVDSTGNSFKWSREVVVYGDVVIEMENKKEGKTDTRVQQIVFTEASPNYSRDVTNNIGTLCVDHNVLAGGALGATFYQIASRNELYNDKIDFEEVLPNEELKAGEPYIFKSTTGKIELFYGATVADAPVAVRGMIGSFANTTLDITEENKSDILYIAQNKLWNCEDLVASDLEVVANRAYIVMSDVPTYAEYQAAQTSNPAPRRRVTLGKDAEQVVTGVENLNASEQPVKLLINGQIFILRGEKMFDATGRLVK